MGADRESSTSDGWHLIAPHNGTYGNPNGVFKGEENLGGGEGLNSQPAAVSWAPGQLDIFVVGAVGNITSNLWHEAWS